MTFHPTAHPNQLTHTTTYLLTHQWIPSSPSSPSSPSPRPHPSLPPPSMPMVAPPGVAPLLRGRSSSTSASYPSSTASVYVACLLTVAYRPCSITPHSHLSFRSSRHWRPTAASFYWPCRTFNYLVPVLYYPFGGCIKLSTITITTIILR